MPATYHITAKASIPRFRDVVNKGEAKTYEFDLSAWAEDNGNVAGVAWSVDSGNASISGEVLTGNIASALITFSESGRSVIKVSADTGADKYVAYLDVLCQETMSSFCDYGMWI